MDGAVVSADGEPLRDYFGRYILKASLGLNRFLQVGEFHDRLALLASRSRYPKLYSFSLHFNGAIYQSINDNENFLGGKV